MKQECVYCDRSSADRNLFCQEIYCPAEQSPIVFDAGDRLGDIEIVRRVGCFRSAALYEAMHQADSVLLKIAHPGFENKERLKREALFLRTAGKDKTPASALPRLRPPYATTTVERDAYGKTVCGDDLLYYYLCDPFEGQLLSAYLLTTPQMWINHAAWLTIKLALAVNSLHLKGLHHFAVSPDSLLVRFDREPPAPQILLVDLGIASDRAGLARDWYPSFVPPAHLAPELLDRTEPPLPDLRTDVYGIGLVLYELLIGRPAIPHRGRGDAETRAAVQQGERAEMVRLSDVSAVGKIALQATAIDPANRQRNAAEVAEQLIAAVGHPPVKKKGPWPSLKTGIIVLEAIVAIAFLVSLAVAMSPAV